MSNNTPQTSQKIRVFLFAIAVIAWLLVVLVGLEACYAGRAFFAERIYQDYFEAQNRKVYRMVPAEELARPENRFTVQEAVAAPGEAFLEPLVKAAASGTTASPADRNARAVLEGVMAAEFDLGGRYLSSYGEPLIEQDLKAYLRREPAAGDWVGVFRELETAREPVTREFSLPGGIPYYYFLKILPGAEGVRLEARDITATKPVAAQHYGEPPGPDSPWEVVFYKYKKNWEKPGDILSTNNFGFRDDDVSVPKPPDMFRIVCVGGSTTEEGNSNDATYPNIMERKLAKRFDEGRVDVVNAGLCAMNTYNMRRRWDDYLAMQPDLVLFYGGVNDITHVHFKRWLAMPGTMKRLARHSFFLTRHFGYSLLPDEAVLRQFMDDTTFRNLRAMLIPLRERGIGLALCSFAYPTLSWTGFRARSYYDVNLREVWEGGGYINFRTYCRIIDLYNEMVREFCREEGLTYVPVAENFVAGPDHFFDVCHMTPLGLELKTNIIGAYMTAWLEDHGVEP